QLVEALGVLPQAPLAELIAGLTPADRKALSGLGLRLGYAHAFLPALLRPGRTALRARLWTAHAGRDSLPELPDGGQVTLRSDDMPEDPAFLALCGFERFGPVALRVDILDRLARLAQRAARNGAFEVDHEMLSLSGCGREELTPVLRGLGYVTERQGDRLSFRYRPRRAPRSQARRRRPRNAASPFADLSRLKLGS
ncbi:MAG TPA: disulfide oxidoreductase, partial [Alphaproteobacteria bacterium]|nr:disulfide oxidoreductase [Alphaproteobacteria bacterium]